MGEEMDAHTLSQVGSAEPQNAEHGYFCLRSSLICPQRAAVGEVGRVIKVISPSDPAQHS